MIRHQNKFRFAIIGASAITKESYLPIAIMTPHLDITHIVDLEQERIKQVVANFQVPVAISDYHELFGKVYGVVACAGLQLSPNRLT